jgi:hypothetical protein
MLLLENQLNLFMIFSDVYTTDRQRGCREPAQCCEASTAGQAIQENVNLKINALSEFSFFILF